MIKPILNFTLQRIQVEETGVAQCNHRATITKLPETFKYNQNFLPPGIEPTTIRSKRWKTECQSSEATEIK